jgi:hypothetical protein
MPDLAIIEAPTREFFESSFMVLAKEIMDLPDPFAPDDQHSTVADILPSDVRFLELPSIETGVPSPISSVDQLMDQMAERDGVQVGWLSRNKTKLAIAAAALTFVDSPISETADRIESAAAWMVPALTAGEVAWIGGGAMMLAAVGSKMKNPFKIKKMVPEIAERANNSILFRSGYWINTIAAVSEFGILTVGVTTEFPVRSWGLASFGFIDLAATYFVRRAIRKGIKSNVAMPGNLAEVEITN